LKAIIDFTLLDGGGRLIWRFRDSFDGKGSIAARESAEKKVFHVLEQYGALKDDASCCYKLSEQRSAIGATISVKARPSR
jgi:hypothetical protein